MCLRFIYDRSKMIELRKKNSTNRHFSLSNSIVLDYSYLHKQLCFEKFLWIPYSNNVILIYTYYIKD